VRARTLVEHSESEGNTHAYQHKDIPSEISTIYCLRLDTHTYETFFFFLINKAFSGEEPAVDAIGIGRASPTMPTREKDFPVEFVFGWSR
jgi:hypothetical protein